MYTLKGIVKTMNELLEELDDAEDELTGEEPEPEENPGNDDSKKLFDLSEIVDEVDIASL